MSEHPDETTLHESSAPSRAVAPHPAAEELYLMREEDARERVEEQVRARTLTLKKMNEPLLMTAEGHERAWHALEKNEARYRTLLHHSREAIYLCDAQTLKLIEANTAFLDLLGYTAEDVTRLSLADLLAYDAAEINIYLNKVLERKEAHVRERLWRRKDGTVLLLEVTSNVIHEHNREIVFSVGRDITARKRAEQEFEQRAGEFAALYETYREIAEYQDLSELLRRIIERAGTLLHAPSAGIYLYNAVENEVELAITTGNVTPVGLKLKIGEGLAGYVAQTRQTQIVTTDAEWEPHATQLAGVAIGAGIGVPMLYHGELIGVLTMAEWGDTARKFTEAEARLLALFASQAASAVANARLFEQMSEGRERLRLLSHQLLQAQEMERRYLARELHDEVGQALTALNLNLQMIRRSTRNPKIQASVNEGLETIEEILQQVRNLTLELHPSVLDDLGLVPALEWFLKTRVARAGLATKLVSTLPETRLASDIELTCFRVAQEALTNVMRHAQARQVVIELHRLSNPEDTQDLLFELVVRDDGVGFDLDAARKRAASGSSLGLIGMHERALLVGGSLEIHSTPGGGTQVRAQFRVTV